MSAVGRIGEAELITMISRWLRRQQPCRGIIRGIGDDCAILKTAARTLVTSDAFVEGVHFRRTWTSARDAGWKALAANVSDIGTGGGTPRAALVSLELPARLPVRWLKEFYAGLLDCGRAYGVSIAGGNLSAAPHVAAHITVTGDAPARRIGRDGARVGDLVVVTGSLGGSLAGLECLRHRRTGTAARAAIARHQRPVPPVPAGRVLARFASAMADVSDGLARDAGHLAKASGVRVALVPGAVPIPFYADALAPSLGYSPQALALESGEEYELVATLPRRNLAAATAALKRLGVHLTVAGEVRRGRGVELVGLRDGAVSGYDHFHG